jgi:hypothetical protein
MKLGSAGEAFFVHQTTEEELIDHENLRTSPLMSPGGEEGGMSPRERIYSFDEEVKLKPEEVMAAVNDMVELEKNLINEEEQHILAA